MGGNDPRGGAIFDPRGMVGKICKEDHYTLLHAKYESSGPCGFGEENLAQGQYWGPYVRTPPPHPEAYHNTTSTQK